VFAVYVPYGEDFKEKSADRSNPASNKVLREEGDRKNLEITKHNYRDNSWSGALEVSAIYVGCAPSVSARPGAACRES
jgi:hypothetical protein